MLFDHIADLTPWWTRIALLNPGAVDANVEVYAMTPAGTLIGGAGNVSTAKFVLPAKTKVARLLGEMIPATQSRTSDGGFVFVRTTNGVPIFGNELFFLSKRRRIRQCRRGAIGVRRLFTAVKLKPTEEWGIVPKDPSDATSN